MKEASEMFGAISFFCNYGPFLNRLLSTTFFINIIDISPAYFLKKDYLMKEIFFTSSFPILLWVNLEADIIP